MTRRAGTQGAASEAGTARAVKVEALWTVQDVSSYLGVPACTVYAWRSAGTGPPGRLVGRRLRYRPEDVLEWVDQLPTAVVS
ncbi:helix-turn-helix transcriptional regulator [Auraticoccus monumenti]|uniref:DNA binding domain-containing protein, excisionase family n=1 Tax=Auraticoccus monumenti TaxID=675864 RepID=A0A1G6WIH3_9ACTN|nr:helix-turn-helix domain-containing protein [Auraticoccus monumenti]SDD65682.1 DNA binding domain-containing protein, excisionase family [Auraticoccus monumenti]